MNALKEAETKIEILEAEIKKLKEQISVYEETEKKAEVLKKVIDYSVTVLSGALD